MKKNIDLKDYFEGDMPICKINDDSFPSLHADSSTKIIGISAKSP